MDKGTKQSQTCYNCGGTYPHEGMPCRVTRKACHNCLKTGHFVRDCKSEHKQPFRKPRAPQNQYQSHANRLNPLNQDPQHQTLPPEITAQGAPEDSNRMLIKMPNSLLSIVTHASHLDMVTPPPPLQQHQLPSKPWDRLHMDFCGPFPTEETILVVVSRSRNNEIH